MCDGSPADEINLTAERRAALLPKLRVLLDQFAQLEELEAPDAEPAFTPWSKREDDDAAR